MILGLEDALRDGAAALRLALSNEQVGKLIEYLGLLEKWNRVYNLTAVREPSLMLTHHLLDSLAVVQPLERQVGSGPWNLLDVGSGGGLPGVVLALCFPEARVTCIDAVAKKVAFVQQVAASLGLGNLTGVHGRVEAHTDLHDVVASRAFASLPDFVKWTRLSLAPGGVWMAMKGKHPDEEIAKVAAEVDVFHVEQLQVPGLDAERCIVWMKPKAA